MLLCENILNNYLIIDINAEIDINFHTSFKFNNELNTFSISSVDMEIDFLRN